MKRLGLLVLAALAAAWVEAAPQKVLRVAYLSAETHFDPASVSDLYSHNIVHEIFEAPLTYDFLAPPDDPAMGARMAAQPLPA